MDGPVSKSRSRRNSRNNSRNSSLNRAVQNGRKKSKDDGFEPDLNICPISKLRIEYVPQVHNRFVTIYTNVSTLCVRV